MSNRFVGIAAVLGLMLLAADGFGAPQGGEVKPEGGQSGAAAPQARKKLTFPTPTSAYTAEERAELAAMVKEAKVFEEASASYRTTVNTIVKREYQKRRDETLSSYETRIKSAELKERKLRDDAIKQHENFLRRYPNDPRWTPDVIFRLAELYFEKAHDEYLMAEARYQKELARYQDLFDQYKAGKVAAEPKVPEPPKQNYQPTIELHRKLVREFPNYRLLDAAIYLLGFCLTEMGKETVGNQAFLALVCDNKYKPPLDDGGETASDLAYADDGLGSARKVGELGAAVPPTTTPMGDGSLLKPQLNLQVYDGCRARNEKSRFNAEAWIRIGEFHFDENQFGEAISAYERVLKLGAKDNSYYDEALYKLAWTYYRADRFTEAIDHFDKLVSYSDEEYERTGKKGSEMRPEALQYLAISFSEEDWDGDTLPDSQTGLQRIEQFYNGRHKEKHVYEVYKRLADIYFDTNKYDDAVRIYKLMLTRWPYRADNPDIQDKVILALERQRRFDEAMTEREEFTRLFGKGTQWEKRNQNNPKALKKAREFDEQALIQAAVYHHNLGKEMRKKALAGDTEALSMAVKEYALAARAYEKYLERFPNTKNSYEIKYSYASCLYYSSRFVEAGRVFGEVRDSNLDNRYQEEAAFSATKAYENYIEMQKKAGAITEPALPTGDAQYASLQPMPMPQPFTLWQKSLDTYAKVLPKSPKTPRLTYKAAEISYRFLHFEDARKRFAEIFKDHCKTEMAINAGQAVLVTYKLAKDMAKMEEWAAKLKSGKCGGGGQLAQKTAADASKLFEGIQFKKAEGLMKQEKWDDAAKAYLEFVERNPKGEDSDKALNNAAVAYEKSKRFESATKLYERIWQEYPKSPHAGNALWRTALNYQNIFEFRKAVNNFLILADSPRFADSPNRKDSIYNAAVILENDQDYAKAARLFLRYADEMGNNKEAAEAYYRAGTIYEKMKDEKAMIRIFREFPNRYGSLPGQERRIVEGLFKIGKVAEDRGDWRTAARYYSMTISEYKRRGMAPASDAAEFAANAAFLLVERKLTGFLKTTIKGALKRIPAQEKKMAKQALDLKKEYEDIFNYKRVRWTLAAMFRFGTIYEHFARTMDSAYRNAPVPAQVKRLGMEAIDIYRSQVDELLMQRVDPIVAQAKKYYASCADKAKEVGVSNKYTEEALRKLSAFDPVQYPLIKRAKVEFSID